MITLVSVPGTGGAPIFESFPAMPGMDAPNIIDPMLAAQGQFWGKPFGPNWNYFFVTYPAAVIPMQPSWEVGINNTVGAVQNYIQGPFFLDGYSQGAIVTSHVWRDEILSPTGRLHNRLNDFRGLTEYGPPCRSPGFAFGNTVFCGTPVPPPVDGKTTGGISGPDDLTEEQLYFPVGHPMAGEIAVYQHGAIGDLYADCPVGDNPWSSTWKTDDPVGYCEWLVYMLVQNISPANLEQLLSAALADLGIALTGLTTLPGLISLILSIIAGASSGAATINIPIGGITTSAQLVGLIEALLNGGMFLFTGATAHGNYDAGPATEYMVELGKSIALAA